MSKIAVIAKITCAEGRRDEVAEALEAMFPQVDTEGGTEIYVLHQDLGHPEVLWMYELYTDEAGLQAHSTSPAMAELFTKLGGDLMGAPPELIMVSPVRAKGVDL